MTTPGLSAGDDRYEGLTGSAHVLHPLDNDLYLVDETLTVEIVAGPTWGTVAVNPDHTVTYTSRYPVTYGDRFSYRLLADVLVSNTVDVVVNSWSTLGTSPDTYSQLAPHEAHVLDPKANDRYPPDATVTVEIVDLPAWGELESNSDGTFTYTSRHGLGIQDSFTYRLLVDGHPLNTSQVSLSFVTTEPICVSTAADENDEDYAPGDLSLREALLVAAGRLGNDVITFDTSLAAQCVSLTLGELPVNSNVVIVGPGHDLLTIDAGQKSGVFKVFSGVTAAISGLTVTGGRAVRGGGVYSEGNLTVTDCLITGNRSVYDGGGVCNYYGSLILSNSTVSGNSAGQDGGGVYHQQHSATITNSMIVGNSAVRYGGGIYRRGGTFNVRNVSIAGNFASSGGGIYLYDSGATVTNSIVALNDAQSATNIKGSLSTRSGFNVINTDPQFVQFVRDPSDGGDGWGDNLNTPNVDESANDDYGNLHVRTGSPAINAGSNALAIDGQGNPLATDLDGNPRVVYGTVDIGAYEFRLSGDSDLDATVGRLDSAALAAHWLMHGGMGWADGDFNGDGSVDDLDLAVLAANWGSQVTLPDAAAGNVTAGTQQAAASQTDPRFVGPRQLLASLAPRRLAPLPRTEDRAAAAVVPAVVDDEVRKPAAATAPSIDPLDWVLSVERVRPRRLAPSGNATQHRAVDRVFALGMLM